MSTKVAVVIPNHKEELSELEKISLAQCRKVLGNYPIIFIGPENINFSYLEPGDKVVYLPKEYFQTLKGYNILSMSPIFYEPFLNFDYMLIYQLDAFVLYDALEEFCRLGYDYIGAPWPYHVYLGVRPPKTPRVGNGGFCLRKVKACYNLVTKCSASPDWKNIIEKFSDDSFFAFCGVNEEMDFNVAPVEVAKFFSMEWYPDRHIKNLGYELPFGCHNWTKFSADFYVELFGKFDYDLRPFRNKMSNNDYEVMLPLLLTKLAMERLIRDLDRKKSLLQYLPTKNFASVRVIRSPDAIKFLTRILTEDNSLADKIFIYDEKDFRNLIRDVNREDLPHLVLCTDYDKSLIAAIENKNVISFRQEYLKSQEKFFHNLGR